MRVFVATVTDEDDNFTEVIGVFVDAGLAREAKRQADEHANECRCP
jgi:hypothetical protein